MSRLQQLNTSLDSIGYFFETHGHFDHKIRLPRATARGKKNGLEEKAAPNLEVVVRRKRRLSGR